MSTPSNSQLEEELFELVCYMVTSARNLISETKLYGPFRLIDAVSRLIDIIDKMGQKTPRLAAIQKKIEDQKYVVMDSEDEFTKALDELVMSLVPLMGKKKA
jgi:hypothetical protein